MHRWLVGFAALAAGLACASTGSAQGDAVGVRVGVNGQLARVVIDSPFAVSVDRVREEPGRVLVGISGLSLTAPLEGQGAGAVKAWRLSAVGGRSRLTLEVMGAAAIVHRFAIDPGPKVDHYRYVIDLGDPTAIASAAPASVGRRTNPRTHSRMIERKVVVIDAGHGGHDPGAQASDANEKDITLAAALHLRDRLERSGRYRVVMTRDTDVFVPLEDRVKIARRAGADLFIALHADSAGADTTPHGASVYTLSDHGVTRVNQVLDGREWFNHAGDRRDPAVRGILLDLTQRTTLNRSNVFAQMLMERLSASIDLLPKSHRDAGYFVLLAPDVPAVLLEMGFISNPADEARLSDPAQRDQLMDEVAGAIDSYFDGGTRVAAN